MVVISLTDTFNFSRLKTLLSRLIKITSTCSLKITSSKMCLYFDKNLIEFPIETYGVDNTIFFTINIIVLYDLIRSLKSNSKCIMIIECKNQDSNKYLLNIVCTNDSKKLKKSNYKRKLYIEKIEEFNTEEIDKAFSKTTYFDAKECIWTLEKWDTPFDSIHFELNENDMILLAKTDEYKAITKISLSSSDHDNIKGVMYTNQFLNMIWVLETISQKLYAYTDPITFNTYIHAESFDSEYLNIKFKI